MQFKIFGRKEQVPPAPMNNEVDVIKAIIEGNTNGADTHMNAYLCNPYVRKAVDIRATSVSTPDLILTDKDGNAVDDPNHPLGRLLSSPNTRQDWHAFVYDIESELALHGIAYIMPEKSGNSVKNLTVIPASRVTVNPSTNWMTPVGYYRVDLGSEQKNVMPSDMIVICPKFKADGYTPVSPVDSAMDAVATQSKGRQWNLSMMDNGGRPLTAILIPDKLTSASYQEFANRYRATMQGASSAGATAILDGGKQIQSIGMSAIDLDFVSGLTQTAKEIAIALNVPPELLGDSANKTYANASEANKEFAMRCVVPELTRICSVLTRSLCRAYPDISIGYDKEMVEGMTEDKTALITALTSCDYLSTNEKRAYLSFDSVKDGDTILTTAGKIPLSDVFLDTDESDDTDPFGDQ